MKIEKSRFLIDFKSRCLEYFRFSCDISSSWPENWIRHSAQPVSCSRSVRLICVFLCVTAMNPPPHAPHWMDADIVITWMVWHLLGQHYSACVCVWCRYRERERAAFRRAAVIRFVDVKSITEAWFVFGSQRENQKTSALLSECVCLF